MNFESCGPDGVYALLLFNCKNCNLQLALILINVFDVNMIEEFLIDG